MDLNQNQYYSIEFPVNDADDQPLVSVESSQFFLYSGQTEILSSPGVFAAGILTVELTDTLALNKTYYFEVWVVVGGKKYMTHSGSLKFNKTLGRIEI